MAPRQPQNPCPPREQLENIMQGTLPFEEVERVAQHVEKCHDCEATLQGLSAEDTFAEILRERAGQADKPEQAVHQLIERLRRQHEDKADSSLAESPHSRTHAFTSAAEPVEIDFLAPAQQPDEIGRLGAYRVLQMLGKGGMGMVFLAHDPHLDRRVALKVMLPRFAANEAAKRRFLREARMAARLKNDHIVHIYQVSEDRGVPYLAMELLEGMPLDQLLQTDRKLTLPQILRIGRDVARGLAAAHDKGLIHRDIKPGNLWLDSTNAGRVKILDFGLARNEKDDIHITQSGAIVGTPAYMSPEQARGEKTVDGRADLFSLGCVLYRLCVGDIPFKGETTMGTLMALAMNNPVAPGDINETIPRPLSELIMQLLEKDPAKRPVSAKAVLARLAEIERSLARREITESLTVANQPAIQPPRRRLSRAALIACAFAGFITLLAGILYIVTDQGTIEIKTDDKNIKVIVEEDGGKVTILDPLSKQTWVVNTGKYTVKLGDGAEGLEIELPNTFTMKRGERQVVTIIRRVNAAVAMGKESEDGKTEGAPRGNGHDGKILGAKWVKADGTPLVGATAIRGLRFSGDKAEQVEFPTLQNLEAVRAPFTLEAFIKHDGAGAKGWLHPLRWAGMFLGVDDSPNWNVIVPDPANKLTNVLYGKGLPVGRTTHVAGVYDRDKVRLFVNGALVGERQVPAATQIKATPRAFTIGGVAWRGEIAEVRASRVARYDKDFTPQDRFVPDKDTFALYHFDEGTGDVLKDSSGNNHHGKIVGAKWVKADGTPTAMTPTLHFDGNARIEVKSLVLPHTSDLTLEAYVAQSEYVANSMPALVGVYGQVSLHANTKNWVMVGHEEFASPRANTPAQLNRRVHLAGVKKGRILWLFVDGKKVGERELNRDDLKQSSGTMRIGDHGFIGILGEVRVSKVARYDKDFTPQLRFDPDADTIALYHFDETTGDKLTDSSGNGHHGKIVGAKWVKADGAPLESDRRALDLALSLGIPVQVNGRDQWIDNRSQLPPDAATLTAFDAQAKHDFDDAILAKLQGCRNLKFFNVDRSKVTDKGMAAVQDCKELNVLHLGFTAITNEGVAHFRDCPELRELGLAFTQVSDAGLAHFRACKKLSILYLGGTKITSAGMEHLKDCTELTVLHVYSTAFGDAGIASLKNCKNLEVLHLQDTPVSDQSIDILRGFTKLSHLRIERTKITAKGLAILKQALPQCNIDWEGQNGSAQAGWHIRFQPALQVREANVKRYQTDMMSRLKQLQAEHADTPWAFLAERESQR